MNVFEEVSRMKQEGKEENQIIQTLQQMKVPPKQIIDALEQAEIKEAVNGETAQQNQQINYDMEPVPSPSNEINREQTQKMKPQHSFQQNEEDYNPQMEEDFYEPGPSNAMQMNDYQDYEQYPEYDNNYDTTSAGANTDTFIDIAEQVFTERSKKLQLKVDFLTQFKEMSEIKLDNLDARLKRMEKLMDQLQLKIIEKVGSYGTNLELIKKEMNMIESSFSKMLTPLAKKTTIKKRKKNNPKR